jgi:hypothetical protein
MEETKQISTEEAMEIINQDSQARASSCWDEIRAALEKHRCVIDVTVVLRGDSHPIPKIEIIPK